MSYLGIGYPRIGSAFGIAASFILCLILSFSAAQARASDTVAQAKRHYQSAVSAISKGDWIAAKNELLQAEKLAPSNALVHYDLALAYSHTGQIKSAKLELDRALQLGLPAAQQADAKQLSQQLASPHSGVSQQAPDGSKSTKSAASRTKPFVGYTSDGNAFTINLDQQGTSFGIVYEDKGFAGPSSTDYREIAVEGKFKTPLGCNSWFGKSAIFILDESSTITIPGPAQCPLPPSSNAIPYWVFESISSAHIAKVQLDGVLYEITQEQVSGLKEFVHKRLPDLAWRNEFEPYAVVGASSSADRFESVLVSQNVPRRFGLAGLETNNFSSSFVEQNSEATVSFSWFVNTGAGPMFTEFTFDIPWQDLFLRYYDVDCNSCIKETMRMRFGGDSSDNAKVQSNRLFRSPYGVSGEEDVYAKYSRAIAFLWYKHMFINVGR